jgi:thiamine pyrophosphate-dependent acetolactate synthase large subunit-like protein
MLPIDIQPQPPAGSEPTSPPPPPLPAYEPSDDSIKAVADLLQNAKRPAIIGGRGAVLSDARDDLYWLGQLIGAVMATSAPANGLFAGLPYSLGISGGLASPFATKLLPRADVVVAVGASLNDWTTKHGEMFSPDSKLVHIDVDPRAIARHRRCDRAIIGDAKASVRKLTAELERRNHHSEGFRENNLARDIASNRWRDDPYNDASTDAWIDPRTLSISLNDILPADKAVAVDSGHFLGYPAMFLDVPDARSWLFVNGFQSVGLGLANAIGAAVARPDRPTVAAIGDGGAFMALAEIETAVRLKLKLLVLIYNDNAYGAEVHHFAPLGHDVTSVQFPDADLAAMARAAGAQGATVRHTDDLRVVATWLDQTDPQPLVLDAKVNPTICADWLAEAFRAG